MNKISLAIFYDHLYFILSKSTQAIATDKILLQNTKNLLDGPSLNFRATHMPFLTGQLFSKYNTKTTEYHCQSPVVAHSIIP